MKLKRVLSLILATALLLSFLPTGVLPIRAETAESTSPTADDYNLITNGNFEQGEAKWTRNSNAPSTSTLLQVVGGELKYDSTATKPGGDAKFYQKLTLETGVYVMSFDTKGKPGTTRLQHLPLKFPQEGFLQFLLLQFLQKDFL